MTCRPLTVWLISTHHSKPSGKWIWSRKSIVYAYTTGILLFASSNIAWCCRISHAC